MPDDSPPQPLLDLIAAQVDPALLRPARDLRGRWTIAHVHTGETLAATFSSQSVSDLFFSPSLGWCESPHVLTDSHSSFAVGPIPFQLKDHIHCRPHA